MNFDDDDFDELSNEDFKKEHNEERQRIKNLPITQKAEEILEIVLKICELIDDNSSEKMLLEMKEVLQENVFLIPAKIFGAEAVELYELKMENAAIIRKAAIEVRLHCRSLEMFGYEDLAYLNLIRVAVDEFRNLFVEWISNFDKTSYIGDLWGMFNPPGISLDDVRKNFENDY